MHLVIDQVVELQHVHVAHRHLPVEELSGTPVDQPGLPARRKFGNLEPFLDLGFVRPIEHRGGNRYAAAKVVCKFRDLVIGERIHVILVTSGAVDLAKLFSQPGGICARIQHLANLPTQMTGGPPKMAFQHLSNVHPGGYAERIQHDIDSGTVFHIRHILDRDNSRNHTLIAVAARHLVSRLQATLDGNEYFDHLEHTGRQIISCLKLPALFIVQVVKPF